MPYRDALDLQMQLWKQRCEEQIPDTVLLVEHNPVITLGARKSENKLLRSEDVLAKKSIDIEPVRRGGGTTAHNPGQIVLYPILNLRSLGLGVNEYVRKLEAIGIELLVEFGVTAERRKGLPGLWIGQKKIGSIGVQIKKWVTLHGMAININNDLTIFDNIVPCGLEGVRITNVLEETGKKNPMADVKEKLAGLCVEHFIKQKNGKYGK